MLRRNPFASLAVLAALIVAATAYPLSAAEESIGETGYYPLKVGTEWEFLSKERTFTAKVVKHEKKGEYMTARIETFVDGRSIMTENLAVTKDAVVRVAAGDVVASKPTIVVKLPPKTGDKWKITADIGPEKLEGDLQCDALDEEVNVAAGKFKTVKITGSYMTTDPEGNKQPITLTTWYADGPGPVKSVIKKEGTEFILDLQKFTAGK
jgi:hypothetical protein